MRILIATTLTLHAAACTNGAETGVLPFTVEDSATMVRTNRRLANIVFSDFVDTCSVADERDHPGSHLFTFLLADLDADAAPSHPGTYPIYTLAAFPLTGLAARCGLTSYDATCNLTLPGECTSGTVTLTRVDATGYAGQYDVVLDGNHLAGSFDSPSCPAVSEAGFGTCQ
jgi:hypothetical protein